MLAASTSILALKNTIGDLLSQADKYEALALAAANHASRTHFTRLAGEQREQAFSFNECLETLETLAAQPGIVAVGECANVA